ncbi:MAG: hypothetical protein IJT11_04465 [Bacteroidaceae bacterium]|nr:hypothetical protein [Bacteroidaceae bacterium]
MARDIHTLMSGTEQKQHFPACYVELPPECEGRRAAFYLATEEFIAEHLPEDSYFFTWQIGPTVVMGRNQVAHQEVDLDFCQREGIDVIRRRSGGGAIFADERNIMTSLVTEVCPVEPLFREYAEAVAEALRTMGAPAIVAGRNDIVLKEPSLPSPEGRENQGGSKVCGNAFYQRGNRSIAHGTMLYDTNPKLMEGALHPDVSKLEQRGVKSVRSRIGLLKDYLSFGVGTLRQRLRLLLCNRAITLSSDDIREIERMEQRYYEPEYFLGSSAHADVVRSHRIPGCGMLEIRFRLSGSFIVNVSLHGDFFDLGQAQETFSAAFVSQAFTPYSLRQAIQDHHPEHSVRGLSEESLIDLILSA